MQAGQYAAELACTLPGLEGWVCNLRNEGVPESRHIDRSSGHDPILDLLAWDVFERDPMDVFEFLIRAGAQSHTSIESWRRRNLATFVGDFIGTLPRMASLPVGCSC
jgi:hypothetical protein